MEQDNSPDFLIWGDRSLPEEKNKTNLTVAKKKTTQHH
jgi:hypothetical protein